MSITLGLLGDHFSIVAADTRATNIFDKNQNDSKEKIFCTKFGWIANGGGVSAQTKLFQAFLQTYDVKTRKQLYTAWLITERDMLRVVKECKNEKQYKEIDLEMNSSNAICSINYFKNKKPVLEIDTMDYAYGRRKLNSQNSLIVNPPKWTKRTKRLVSKYSELAKGITDIHHAVYVLACLLNDLSKISKWISNILDCGISIAISDDKIILLHIRETAKAIIEQYKDKHDLFEIMTPCDIKVAEE